MGQRETPGRLGGRSRARQSLGRPRDPAQVFSVAWNHPVRSHRRFPAQTGNDPGRFHSPAASVRHFSRCTESLDRFGDTFPAGLFCFLHDGSFLGRPDLRFTRHFSGLRFAGVHRKVLPARASYADPMAGNLIDRGGCRLRDAGTGAYQTCFRGTARGETPRRRSCSEGRSDEGDLYLERDRSGCSGFGHRRCAACRAR